MIRLKLMIKLKLFNNYIKQITINYFSGHEKDPHKSL